MESQHTPRGRRSVLLAAAHLSFFLVPILAMALIATSSRPAWERSHAKAAALWQLVAGCFWAAMVLLAAQLPAGVQVWGAPASLGWAAALLLTMTGVTRALAGETLAAPVDVWRRLIRMHAAQR